MKFKIISMLVTLGMLSIMPLIYMGKIDPVAILGGEIPGITGDGNETIEQLKAKAPKNLANVTTNEKVQVYRWRDQNGVMQFSNAPPPGVRGAEQVQLNPDDNVIQATKVPEVEVRQQTTSAVDAPSPYSIKGMKKVMEDAKAVEGILQQRHDDQQKMLNNL